MTNAAEDIFILKERLVVGPVSHRGEELNGVGHEQIVLSGRARVQ